MSLSALTILSNWNMYMKQTVGRHRNRMAKTFALITAQCSLHCSESRSPHFSTDENLGQRRRRGFTGPGTSCRADVGVRVGETIVETGLWEGLERMEPWISSSDESPASAWLMLRKVL